MLSRATLARMCGREPTMAERIADVMDNEAITQMMAEYGATLLRAEVNPHPKEEE